MTTNNEHWDGLTFGEFLDQFNTYKKDRHNQFDNFTYLKWNEDKWKWTLLNNCRFAVAESANVEELRIIANNLK